MYDIKVETLKVGDQVGVSGSRWNAPAEIRTVAKKTATQVVLNDGSRWNKNGRNIGGDKWHGSYLLTVEDATQRREEEMTRRKRLQRINAIRDVDLGKVSDAGLDLMLRVADENKA